MPRVVLFSPWKWECAQSRSWVCFLKEKRESHKSGCTAGLELQSPAGTMDPHLDPNLGVFFASSTSLFHPPSCGDQQWPSLRQPFAISTHSQPPQMLYQNPQRYLKGQQGK